jgi:drug/metabolite transporter (DMT)-like permease
VVSALVAVQVMFASNAVVGKIALREVSPLGLVAFRVVVAALVLTAIRSASRWERIPLGELPALMAYAFLGIAANQLLFMEGLKRSTATNAVVIGTTIPVFTVAVALALRQETATPTKLIGLTVALLGALGVVGAARFESAARLTGNLLLVANSLCYAIYLVISRRLLLRYRTATVMANVFALAIPMILPFAGAPLRAAAGWSTVAWAAMSWVAIGPTVLAYFLNGYALRRTSASEVAVFIYVQPLVGAVLAAVALGERATTMTYVGAVFIAAGIWLVTQERARQAAPSL